MLYRVCFKICHFGRLCCLFIILSSFLLVSCKNNNYSIQHANLQNDERVNDAIEFVETEYREIYNNIDIIDDINIRIIYTRIINIKEDAGDNFEDVEYVVEFFALYDHDICEYDYQLTTNNFVVVYNDGTKSLATDPFLKYRSINYNNSFSEIVYSVEDFGSEYNCILSIK